MALKKIEDMDYYEILNLERTASEQDIERAYHLGKTTYSKDSLAHYSLLPERDRLYLLGKIEEAYEYLKDPERRRLYDIKTIKESLAIENIIYFRKSTQKLEIEDAEERVSLGRKIKGLFSRKRKRVLHTD